MMMEIKTCEQYVLAQLFEQQDENERILAESRAMREALDEARRELADMDDRMNSAMARAIREEGRRAIMDVATDGQSYKAPVRSYDDRAVPYEEWAVNALRGNDIPACVSLTEVLREFEPELRALYAERLQAAGIADGGDGE